MTAPSRVLTASRTLTAVKGKALYHDGIDDYVSIPDDPSLDITSEITIEAWVKPFGSYGDLYYPAIVRKEGAYALRYRHTNGALNGIVWIGGTPYLTNDLANAWDTTKWTHFVFVYDGQYLRLYCNGVEAVSPIAQTGSIDTVALMLGIGAQGDGSNPLNGTIALVRIYERALSAAEVLYNKEHPYNPILHGCVLWLGHDSIDEGAGMWYDKTSYGNDGVIYGATAVEMNKLAGRVLSV